MLFILALMLAQWGVVNSGPTLPPMCRIGDVYISTTTPTLSLCTTANIWTALQSLTPPVTLTGGVTGTGTGTLAATVVTNANLTGAVASVGNATTYAAVLPYALGGVSGCAATSATTGTIAVAMTTRCVAITPSGNATFNASGGVAGQILVFSITTSGASSFTLTWGTNFRKTGTLATGTTTARFFTVTFLCLDGTTWTEISRTAVQT